MSQQKRKRNGLELDEDVEMNSVFECPLLNAMERRCRGVDILSGDIHQELLPVCAAHQLCYLCVSIDIPDLVTRNVWTYISCNFRGVRQTLVT